MEAHSSCNLKQCMAHMAYAKFFGDAYLGWWPLPIIKTRTLNPLDKTTVPTTMESQLANGSYLWRSQLAQPRIIEVNSVKLNVVGYRLTKVASLVQLVIRLGDMK